MGCLPGNLSFPAPANLPSAAGSCDGNEGNFSGGRGSNGLGVLIENNHTPSYRPGVVHEARAYSRDSESGAADLLPRFSSPAFSNLNTLHRAGPARTRGRQASSRAVDQLICIEIAWHHAHGRHTHAKGRGRIKVGAVAAARSLAEVRNCIIGDGQRATPLAVRQDCRDPPAAECDELDFVRFECGASSAERFALCSVANSPVGSE